MAPKTIFATVICIAVLVCNAASAAEAYKPDEFLRLDLSKAALSPAPLGPASGFTPVPAETKAADNDGKAHARVEPKSEPKPVVREPRIAHLRVVKPHGPARTRLARRHTNPLDAQAFDTRI